MSHLIAQGGQLSFEKNQLEQDVSQMSRDSRAYKPKTGISCPSLLAYPQAIRGGCGSEESVYNLAVSATGYETELQDGLDTPYATDQRAGQPGAYVARRN